MQIPAVKLDRLSPEVIQRTIQRKKTNEDMVLLDHKDNINVEKTNGSSTNTQPSVNGSVNSAVSAKSFYGLKTKEPEKPFEIQPVLVNKPKKAKWFWIGNQTLKQWPNLAIKRFEAELPSSKFIESENNKMDTQNEEASDVQEIAAVPDVQEIKSQTSLNVTHGSLNGSTANEAATLNFFNEDIICPHNNLSPTENKRLVCSDAWEIIYVNYFYKADLMSQNGFSRVHQEGNNSVGKVFTNESVECGICLVGKFFFFL